MLEKGFGDHVGQERECAGHVELEKVFASYMAQEKGGASHVVR